MNATHTTRDGSITKQVRLRKDIDPSTIENLPQILTLMMLKDAILSGHRWYESVRNGSEVEAFSDRTFSIVSGAGWAAEAIRLLKDLEEQGIISDETISSLPNAESIDPKVVWEECIKSPSPTMGKLHDIRDAGFAHFHNHKKKENRKRYKLAHTAIEALSKGEIDAPFVEWTEENGKKRNTKSCATFAMMAILNHVFDISGGSMPKELPEIGDQVMKIGILLENIIAALLEESGMSFEPYEAVSK